MSDAAIVGIVGILATTVLGPVIAYQIRKDEDSRREIVETLDGAVAALTTAEGTVRWVRTNFKGRATRRSCYLRSNARSGTSRS
jgi:hypothetical protein